MHGAISSTWRSYGTNEDLRDCCYPLPILIGIPMEQINTLPKFVLITGFLNYSANQNNLPVPAGKDHKGSEEINLSPRWGLRQEKNGSSTNLKCLWH